MVIDTRHLRIFLVTCLMTLLIGMTLPGASAKEIFNGWVQENTPFNASDREYMAGYYPQVNKVSIIVEGSTTLVGLGDCELKGNFQYCFDDVKNDTQIVYIDVGSYKEAKEVSEIQLRILELAPKITVSTSASVTTLSPGEETKFTATLTNDGDKRSGTITFRSEFPQSVSVKSSFIEPYMNAVKWDGKLNPGDEKIITYKLIAKDYAEFETFATVNHEGDNTTIESTKVKISIIPPFELTAEVTTDAALMNATINYTLTFENKHGSKVLEIKELFIVFPKGLVVEDPSEFRKHDNGFIIDDEINVGGNSEKVFVFQVEADNAGDYSIVADIDILMDDERKDIELITGIAFGTSKSIPILNVSPSEIDSFKTITIKVELENKDVEDTTSEVEIESDLFKGITIKNIAIAAKKKKTVFEKSIQAPDVESETEYYVKVTSRQEVDGETVEFVRESKVKVTPRDALVRLEKNITKLENGDVEIKLTVTNPTDTVAKEVEVVDMIPKNILIIAGNRVSAKMTVGAGVTTSLLNYTLRPTDAFLDDRFEIQHTLNAKDADDDLFVLEDTSEVILRDGGSVNLTDGGNAATANNASGVTDSLKLPEPDKKPGVISKFFGKIKAFFTGIFS